MKPGSCFLVPVQAPPEAYAPVDIRPARIRSREGCQRSSGKCQSSSTARKRSLKARVSSRTKEQRPRPFLFPVEYRALVGFWQVLQTVETSRALAESRVALEGRRCSMP